MEMPSKKEIKKAKEKMQKIYAHYRYLADNAGNDVLRKKIEELAREHINSKIDELYYGVELPLQNRRRELEEMLKKAKNEEKKG
jgi:hypothetical protein